MAEWPLPGAEIAFAYPFVREQYTLMDMDGPHEIKTWRPGTRVEEVWRTDNPGPEDSPRHESVADGMGEQIVTVVSVHKPGKYPARVFFTRQWKNPDGEIFGKPALQIKALTAFRTLTRGYRHDFKIAETV